MKGVMDREMSAHVSNMANGRSLGQYRSIGCVDGVCESCEHCCVDNEDGPERTTRSPLGTCMSCKGGQGEQTQSNDGSAGRTYSVGGVVRDQDASWTEDTRVMTLCVSMD